MVLEIYGLAILNSNGWIHIGLYWFFAVWFLVTLVMTPATQYIVAKLMKQNIIHVITRGKHHKLVRGKIEGGALKSKEFGRFTISPDAVYQSDTKTPFMLAFEAYGINFKPEFAAFASKMKEYGFRNIGEFYKYREAKIAEIEAKIREIYETMRKRKSQVFEQLEALKESSEEAKTLKDELERFIESGRETVEGLEREKDELAIWEQKLNTAETITIHDIMGWFQRNINPAIIEAKIQRSVSIELERARNAFLQYIVPAGVFLIMAGIAFAIFQQYFGTSTVDPNAIVQAVEQGLSKSNVTK